MPTALFHVQFDVVRRSKGQNALKVACYNAAARVEAPDGTTYDFRRKRREHHGHVVLLPPDAPAEYQSAGKLWAHLEGLERQANGQPARLIEFSIPRSVPAGERMNFACAIIRPYVEAGMAAQVDIHVVKASDGEEQPHAHVVLTMRRLSPEGFSPKKERSWNQMFSEQRGRVQRAAIAERMNQWMLANKIDVTVDHRSRKERGDDTPSEWNVDKKAWEAWKKDKDSAAAEPVREQLAARKTRRQYQAARRVAQQAEAELEGISRQWQRHQPGVFGPGRQRRQNEPLAWDSAWSPKIGGAIAGFEIKDSFAVLTLRNGSQVIDSGSRIAIQGAVTRDAIAVMIQQAERHGWSRVMVTGSQEDQAKIAAALAKRGIEIANPPTPAPEPMPIPQYKPSWATSQRHA